MPANLYAALSKVLQGVAVMPGLQLETSSRGEAGKIDSFLARKFDALRPNTAG